MGFLEGVAKEILYRLEKETSRIPLSELRHQYSNNIEDLKIGLRELEESDLIQRDKDGIVDDIVYVTSPSFRKPSYMK